MPSIGAPLNPIHIEPVDLIVLSHFHMMKALRARLVHELIVGSLSHSIVLDIVFHARRSADFNGL